MDTKSPIAVRDEADSVDSAMLSLAWRRIGHMMRTQQKWRTKNYVQLQKWDLENSNAMEGVREWKKERWGEVKM